MTIALIGALQLEVAPLMREARASPLDKRLGQPIYGGQLGAHDVLIVEVGIGKVRAAATLQSVIESYSIDGVIGLGSAGAINPKLNLGDIVVARRVTQHDFVLVTQRVLLGGHKEWIRTNAKLSKQLLEAGQRVGLADRIKLGSIITGDAVVVESASRHRLWQSFRADCVEMEGAALGLVCTLNQIPFALVRGLTDKADEQAFGSFKASIKDVSEAVAKVVAECVREL